MGDVPPLSFFKKKKKIGLFHERPAHTHSNLVYFWGQPAHILTLVYFHGLPALLIGLT
jgi:hypothetical protein